VIDAGLDTTLGLDAPFLNHLVFLANHRGEVVIDAGGVTVRSSLEGFSFWSPGSPNAAVPSGVRCVRLMPNATLTWANRLMPAGFARAESLTYLQSALQKPSPPQHVGSDEVVVVSNDTEAITFADVQLAGFIEPDDPTRQLWQRVFEEVACRVFHRPDHRLYLVTAAGRPSAVGLLAFAAGIAGLYAVATRPEMRKRGLARLLLDTARNDAQRMGFARLILQAETGSYADRLYRGAGFTEAYVATFWRHS
jgi:GNAT superfamily N-acetyltransferase